MSKAITRTGEAEITLRMGGQRALLIVETGSRAATHGLLSYFAGAPCQVRPIAVGPVVACAAWVPEGIPSPLDAMAEHLRSRYPLSICEPGFTPSMYRVALQLARDAEGEVRPLPACDSCGAPEPFPTTLRLAEGEHHREIHFCHACLKGLHPETPLAFCRGLLERTGELAEWREAYLEEPRQEPGTIRCRLVLDAEPAGALAGV